ncbi:hypothetical protein GCM10022630_01590 [Thermobifida alba]
MRSPSRTISAGTSPVTILQNKQSDRLSVTAPHLPRKNSGRFPGPHHAGPRGRSAAEGGGRPRATAPAAAPSPLSWFFVPPVPPPAPAEPGTPTTLRAPKEVMDAFSGKQQSPTKREERHGLS